MLAKRNAEFLAPGPNVPFQKGGWPRSNPEAAAELRRGDGPFHFAGNQVTALRGWQEGALLAAHAAADAIHRKFTNRQCIYNFKTIHFTGRIAHSLVMIEAILSGCPENSVHASNTASERSRRRRIACSPAFRISDTRREGLIAPQGGALLNGPRNWNVMMSGSITNNRMSVNCLQLFCPKFQQQLGSVDYNWP